MLKIVSNKIRCLWCGEVLESFSVHDFKRCRCGKCFTDGGLEYLHRGFEGDKPEDIYEDLSVYYDPETKRSLTAKEANVKDIPQPPKENKEDPSLTTDIPEVTEESKDDEPEKPVKKKPIRGRYNFDTGETIAEYTE
jgi:hypothetical protein